jgi:pilus assembly protein Flp/PilA
MLHHARAIAIRLWKDERGASLLEYSVLVGLITAGVVATISGVALWTGGRWTALNTVLTGSGSGAGSGGGSQ